MVNTSKKDDKVTNRFRLFSSESIVDTRQNIIIALKGSINNGSYITPEQ
jgi:hypothetical protein